MAHDESLNCTACACLAGNRCAFHGVELENPAFTVCAHFQLEGEPPEAMPFEFPALQELSPDWIYAFEPGSDAEPQIQVAQRRRQRTDRLVRPLPPLPDAPGRATGAASEDRFVGALLGLGIGDALGFPAEGRSPAEIEMIYGAPLTGYTGRIGRRHTWPVAQATKDTQLALLLGESLVESGRLDLDDFAERLIRWLPSALRAGRSTVQAIEALREGRHWSVSGVASNGVGATVRIAPLALLRANDYGWLRQEAIAQSLVTHTGPSAYAAAVVFGTAIAALVGTPAGELATEPFLELLTTAVRGIDTGLAERLGRIRELLAAGTPASAAVAELKTGGYVLECVPSAFYCFLAAKDDPRRVLLAAANGGFDATSTTAMAGALAGAYHGRSGLPPELADALPMAPFLVALGTRLHALAAE